MSIELQKCIVCGIHEPINKINNGICEYCSEGQKLKVNGNSSLGQHHAVENRYLVLGFFEFAILSTLMFVFFPWSLLFCLVFYGMQETKLIIIALFHDFVKTVLAILLVAFLLIVIIIVLFAVFSGGL